jgi:hypothetical protein
VIDAFVAGANNSQAKRIHFAIDRWSDQFLLREALAEAKQFPFRT